MLLVSAGTASPFISSELVASGLDRPIYVTAPAGDPRLFIVEQKGTVRLLKEGSLLPEPFLDIDALVKDPFQFSEQGLLGLAFHPDFATNRYFFVNYTDNAGNTVIARYEADAMDPDVADLGSAEIVLTQAQPASNHNGGTLEFGPDGYLYMGFGDGGGSGDPDSLAQDPTTLLGKFVRIDVDPLPYAVPADNPFVGNPSVLDEIWAIGLRNPYRWSFDRSTGDLWIADVGQSAWEEIDFEPAGSGGGRNYGWRYMEGSHCFKPPSDCGADTLDLPIYEYGHTEGNCSITGGYVYRGTAIPELLGHYLFGDYCSDRIWALRYEGNEITSLVELTDLLNPDGRVDGLAAIGQDGAGELYLVDRDGTTDGEVYRIVPDPTGVGETSGAAPSLRMGPGFPNPSGARTASELVLPAPGHVTVRVFNAAGRAVRTVLSENRQPGTHVIEWDGTDHRGDAVPSGVYFVRAEIDGRAVTRKVSVVR
jgi:glucose/arabinose dehydrogenase